MLLAQMTFQTPNLNLVDMVAAISASMVASVIVYLMYHLFYGSRTIGAGVDRSFIIGGPAITALFLGIQSSIPLSLGLLGALSFVRFRTPVKDSAEIGFLLLLIAASIGIATGTYSIVIVLFLLVFLVLSAQRFIQNRYSFQRFANLMISLGKDTYTDIEDDMTQLLHAHLGQVNPKTLSVMEGRISLQYQFRNKPDFSKTELIKKINSMAGQDNIELFFSSA